MVNDKGEIPWLKEGNLMEFFCELIDQNDQLIDSENLYCIKCLQQQKTQAFDNESAYNILLEHLVSEHQMEPMIPVVVEKKNLTPTVTPGAVQKANNCRLGAKNSVLANYYSVLEDGKGMIKCDMCTKNGLSSIFAKGSAHTILFRHLRMTHNIIIHTPKAAVEDEPQRKNISTAWKYFCKITKKGQIIEDGFLYCGECLKKNIKKRYKSTTSTGTLSIHLQVHHNILCDELWNGSPVNKTRKFFKKRNNDPTHVYCRLCLKANKYQKYKVSTSTSTLKIHLENKHGLDPFDSDVNLTNSSDEDSDNEGVRLEHVNEPVNEDYTECMLCSDEGVDTGFTGDNREALLNEHLATQHGINTEHKEEHLIEDEPMVFEAQLIPNIPNQASFSPAPVVETVIESDLTTLCRSCGDEIDDSTSCKFSTTQKIGNLITSLEEMYQKITGIIPGIQTKLSQIICIPCKNILVGAYTFRDQALKTEVEMIESLQNRVEKIHESEPSFTDPLDYEVVPDESVQTTEDIEALEELENETPLLAVLVENLPKKRKRNSVQHLPEFDILKSPEGIYNCKQCPKKFLQISVLQNHVATRHRYSCTDCHLGFATTMQLSAHTFSHSNSEALRPHACTYCDRKFCSEDVLKTHLKFVHNIFGDTTFLGTQQCTTCNKTFTSKNGLSRHIKLHNGHYHPCEQCGSKFSMLSALHVHIKTVHGGERSFQCNKCPKVYKRNSHLLKHKESEHLKLKFYCKMCDKTISGRWNFNAHVKKFHPEKVGNREQAKEPDTDGEVSKLNT